MGEMKKARRCRALLLALFSLPFAHLYRLSYWGRRLQQGVNLAGFSADFAKQKLAFSIEKPCSRKAYDI